MKNIATLTLFLLLSVSLFAQEDINKFDSKGQRHGLWKGIYEESKRPRYEGTFDHGKETGTFKYFDDTKAGTVIATREFKKDGSCYTTFFDQKGNKVSEGKMINKVHEGQWKYYHKESPVIMAIENYKKGKLNGIRKVFHKNKAINEETEYVNGVKNGIYRKYSENGVVLEDAVYKNGEFHGLATYKDVDGNLVAQGQFVLGRKRGIWKFYENGKLVREKNMSERRTAKKKTE
jgi:antitoxin component YwqK of YwqJK toxin-antitoxin module